jgi:hypothetical protein
MEYESYLESVSRKLEADGYRIETAVSIPAYQVDLYAFKDITETSVITSTHKLMIFLFIKAPQITQDIVRDACNSALTYELGKRGRVVLPWAGLYATRLIFPVLISSSIADDVIALVRSYSPFSPQQYVRPVLVNLGTGEVHHHAGLVLWGAGYQRVSNHVVDKFIRP